ncbi:MAG: DUF2282 domain-containing protein [Legionellales bacterium]|jgi:uncharacterized membrane protein
MKKLNLLAAMTAAIALNSGVGFAADEMEKCEVIDKNGKNIIKANQTDCAVKGIHSCAGQNKAGETGAFIEVPKGQCAKINAGDLSGVSADIKSKIDVVS